MGWEVYIKNGVSVYILWGVKRADRGLRGGSSRFR